MYDKRVLLSYCETYVIYTKTRVKCYLLANNKINMESHALSSVDLVSKELLTSATKENKSDSLTKEQKCDSECDKNESSDMTTDCENNDKVSKD